MNYLKSKTLWFAILLAVGGVLEQSQSVVTQLVGPENTGIVMLGISVGVALLRVVTTQPLSKK
jgi:hypothetical protein